MVKTLHLTLTKAPFEVMATGEKVFEFRKPSRWIMARLVDNDYDFIEFTNGYGKDKPTFTCEYGGYYVCPVTRVNSYSNGLKVKVYKGDIAIILGEIQQVKNLVEPTCQLLPNCPLCKHEYDFLEYSDQVCEECHYSVRDKKTTYTPC